MKRPSFRRIWQKFVEWGFLVVAFLFISECTLGIATEKSIERTDALLVMWSRPADYPRKVKISIDGVRAVFRRGDPSYEQLVKLLKSPDPVKMFEANEHFGPRTRCGEIEVSSLFIPIGFPIYRQDDAPGVYWWTKPCPSGRESRVFTIDPRVIALIKLTGAKE